MKSEEWRVKNEEWKVKNEAKRMSLGMWWRGSYNYCIKEAVRKVLFMKGDLQIAPTAEPKKTDFQRDKIWKIFDLNFEK